MDYRGNGHTNTCGDPDCNWECLIPEPKSSKYSFCDKFGDEIIDLTKSDDTSSEESDDTSSEKSDDTSESDDDATNVSDSDEDQNDASEPEDTESDNSVFDCESDESDDLNSAD